MMMRVAEPNLLSLEEAYIFWAAIRLPLLHSVVFATIDIAGIANFLFSSM